MSEGEPGALLDAMMITAAQKVEHYEIATYGTVRTYAQVLGERNVARLLEQTLKEEKAADKKLTGIAEGSVNKRAAREFHEQTTAAERVQSGARWLGATVGAAVKRVMPKAEASERRSDSKRGSSRGSAGRRRTGGGRPSRGSR